MNKCIKIFLILNLFNFIMIGCNSERETLNHSQSKDERISESIQSINSLLESITQNQFLKTNSEEDRYFIKRTLISIKTYLKAIDLKPSDQEFIHSLSIELKKLTQFPVVVQDQGRLNRVTKLVREILYDFAKAAGVKNKNLSTELFSSKFTDGVYPFASFASKSNWRTGWALDRSFAKVSGAGNRAWLLTPGFDLTETVKPKFRFRHTINISDNDRSDIPVNIPVMLQDVFNVFVSTDYVSGNPWEANWTKIDLKRIPTGRDFHTVSSTFIDLEKYKDENVTIAFNFDYDSRKHGNHYVTWQIEKFELLGNGKLIKIYERPQSLFTYLYNSAKLDPSHVIKMAQDAPDWEPFGFGGGFKFAKIASNQSEASSWLVTPKIQLRDAKNMYLRIAHTVRNPDFEYLKIGLSTDYAGGDPTKATWIQIETQPDDPVAADSWVDLLTKKFDLSDYQNQDIVIGFEFNSANYEDMIWEIEAITIEGIGDEIKYKKYPLNFETPVETSTDTSTLTGTLP